MFGVSASTAFAVAGLGLNLFNSYESASAQAASKSEAEALRKKQALLDLNKLKIAENIQSRADDVQGIWQSYYLPVELETLSEICSEPEATANYGAVSQRAIAEITKAFALKKKLKTYCAPPQQVGLRMEAEATISMQQADAVSGQIRIEKKKEDARVKLVNAQRMNNRLNIINPGRGHAARVSSTLEAAAKDYDALSKEAAKGIADASKVMGRAHQALITQGKEFLKDGLPKIREWTKQDPIQQERLSFKNNDSTDNKSSLNISIDVNKLSTETEDNSTDDSAWYAGSNE